MTRPRPVVLFSQEEIARRITEVGAEIGRAFAGREIAVLGLMKGCLVFMADLIRAIPLDLSVHFLGVSSLPENAGGGGDAITYTSSVPFEDRDVLLLEGVIDTGITLSFLLDQMREHHPRSLRVCALIDRPTDRKIDVHPDWALFTLPQPREGRFVVGYGLDHAESYRGLPYLGFIPRPAEPARGVSS